MTKIIAESKGPRTFNRVWDSPNYHRYEMEHDGLKFILYFPKETDIRRYGPEELQAIITVLDLRVAEDTPNVKPYGITGRSYEKQRLLEQEFRAFRSAQLELLQEIVKNTTPKKPNGRRRAKRA